MGGVAAEDVENGAVGDGFGGVLIWGSEVMIYKLIKDFGVTEF